MTGIIAEVIRYPHGFASVRSYSERARPSEMSIMELAPLLPRICPSATRGCGSKRAFRYREYPSMAAWARPSTPVTQIRSPGREPFLLTRCPGSTVPRPVETRVSSSWLSMSPPTSSAPNRSQQSFAPTMTGRRRSARSRPTARRIHRGAAPMEAMSERVTATAIHPHCQSVIPSRKSVFVWSMSVVATMIRSPRGRTAQSSLARSPTMSRIDSSRSRSSTLPHLLLPLCPVLPEEVLHLGLFPLDPVLLPILLPVREGPVDNVPGYRTRGSPHLDFPGRDPPTRTVVPPRPARSFTTARPHPSALAT